MKQPMQTAEEIVGNVATLFILEPRLDAARGTQLKDLVRRMVGEGHRSIVLDLSRVEFVDSTGLGAIVSSRKLVHGGGDLVLAGVSGSVLALFQLTRMDKVFALYSSRMEAIQAIAAKPWTVS
jgi:anti-sigma B factor antagonist